MKKVMRNKLAAAVLGISLFTTSTSAFAAPASGTLANDKVDQSTNAIIAEKVAANPDMNCMELFFSMYLEKLEAIRIVATQQQPDPVVTADVQADTAAAPTIVATPEAKPAVKTATKVSKPKKTVQAAASSNSSAITTASGSSVNYSKMISMKASAYSSDSAENGGWGAVDYFGNPLKVGTVAVDPSVIPLNSKLYIVGYNSNGLPVNGMMATASDIGGAIKGNRIDIFIPGSPERVNQFGFQSVKVYVLK